jgi:uncharacterized LabA/DUF88 family protein
MTVGTVQSPVARLRVRVFIDFWNFQLSVKSLDSTVQIDWTKLGPLLTREAAAQIDATASPLFEGMHVYGSYDANKPNDAKLKNWFTNRLDKMPGVNVIALERQQKRGYAKCPHCQAETIKCHACGGDMRGTEEKGVDTRIVTDMISLAWSGSYDAAVLVSSDRDFVPVAEFLQAKGIKIIHGAFPPKGSHLSQKCWANLNMPALLPQFKR